MRLKRQVGRRRSCNLLLLTFIAVVALLLLLHSDQLLSGNGRRPGLPVVTTLAMADALGSVITGVCDCVFLCVCPRSKRKMTSAIKTKWYTYCMPYGCGTLV